MVIARLFYIYYTRSHDTWLQFHLYFQHGQGKPIVPSPRSTVLRNDKALSLLVFGMCGCLRSWMLPYRKPSSCFLYNSPHSLYMIVHRFRRLINITKSIGIDSIAGVVHPWGFKNYLLSRSYFSLCDPEQLRRRCLSSRAKARNVSRSLWKTRAKSLKTCRSRERREHHWIAMCINRRRFRVQQLGFFSAWSNKYIVTRNTSWNSLWSSG